MLNNSRKMGFTLIELSIVLVIIGLIVGGVLAGKDLIRSAELRSIVSEADAYKSAVNAFKLKYNCLPGDCPNATTFFGAKASCSNSTTYTTTCNGNGNSTINVSSSTVAVGNETFLFWQHLSLANLVGGNFNGVEGGSGAFHVIPGTNSPLPRIQNSGWAATNQNATLWATPTFNIDFGNYLIIGYPVSPTGWLDGPTLSSIETYNIDKKVDDGKPATGKFIARWYSSPCTNAASGTDFTADYVLTDTTLSCVPQFIRVF